MVFNTYIQATTENGISAAPDILFPGNDCPPEVLNNTPGKSAVYLFYYFAICTQRRIDVGLKFFIRCVPSCLL